MAVSDTEKTAMAQQQWNNGYPLQQRQQVPQQPQQPYPNPNPYPNPSPNQPMMPNAPMRPIQYQPNVPMGPNMTYGPNGPMGPWPPRKKKLYEKPWFWIVTVFTVLILILSQCSGSSNNPSASSSTSASASESADPSPLPTYSSGGTATVPSFDADSLVGKGVVDANNTITEAGLHTVMIFAGDDSNMDSTKQILEDANSPAPSATWVVQEAKKDGDTVTLTVESQENIDRAKALEEQRKQLEQKLSSDVVAETCKAYGDSQYPYGYKQHDIIGVLQKPIPSDANTWYYKVQSDITNQYGATMENVNVECYVTGTTSSPQVSTWNAY